MPGGASLTGANWFARARLAVSEFGRLGLRHVPDAPALPVRDPWPGDPARGARIMRGEFDYLGGALPIKLGGWSDPAGSLLVRSALHGFTWLRDLRALGGDGARARARSLVQDWINASAHDPVANYPDVMGARISAWLSQYDFFAASADDQYRQRLMARLLADARALAVAIPVEYNDGRAMLAIKGLIAAATAIPEHDALLQRALKFLPAELGRQVFPDGMHRERSPAAHLAALQNLIEIRALLQAGQGNGTAQPSGVTSLTVASSATGTPTLAGTIERMSAALRLLRHGDGSLALFNGTVEIAPSLIDLVLTQAGRASRMQAALEDGGFTRLQAGRTVVIADTGAPPPPGLDRFAHAGTLSFELSIGRERLIVNCGARPGASSAWHDALRATAAHSALVVADTNSSEVIASDKTNHGGLGKRVGRVEIARQETNGAQWLDMTEDGWSRTLGILHHRRLYLSADGDDLRGEDLMEGEAPYGGVVRFHLHPNVQANLQQDREAVLLRLPLGSFWRLRADGGLLAIEESIYFGGDEPRRSEQVTITIPSDGPQQAKWAISRLA